MWIFLALLSAFFTGLVAVVSKIGLQKVDSSAGFAIQSVMILLVTWIYVFVTRKQTEFGSLGAREFGFLCLAGVISAAAYLCYFGAIKMGDVSRVAPVDRLSLVFSIVLASMFLAEKISFLVVLGGSLMSLGAILIAIGGTGK